MWSMGSPVLLTRDRPVRTLEDLRGFVASRWVADQGFSAAQLVLLILAAFIVLGTFLDGFAILVLTIPLVQPIPVSMGAIYRGVVPFWLAMLATLVLIALLPQIATFLPRAMYG